MKLTIFLFIMLTSLIGHSSADVSCWDGDCLSAGWTWTDSSGVKNDYACYRDGCKKSGWITKGPGRSTYTQCKTEGCFKEGWYEIGQENQNLLRTIVCRSDENDIKTTNCLKNGWVIYSTQGQEAVISCHKKDCEKNGWLVQTSYKMSQVYCKSGGCFITGWNEL